MRKEIASHPDFMNEKTKLEHYINSRGHAFLFIPKYHCEIYPNEHYWSQAKRHKRLHVGVSAWTPGWNSARRACKELLQAI